MKFSVGKYKVLHLGRNNSSSKDRLGTKLGSSFAQKLGSSVRETWPYRSEAREESSKVVEFLDHFMYKERMRGLGLKRKFKGGWYPCI